MEGNKPKIDGEERTVTSAAIGAGRVEKMSV
jgi:hypothetical protein